MKDFSGSATVCKIDPTLPIICLFCGLIRCVYLLQLEMEEGDEIDAMLHQTGGTSGDVWV
ncbi:hypothetical protein HanRHA438_Chr03g0129891 [Helianthus annuus]|nr:hypothetical protein HanRHA438_Chr03g0129891 [Helianthus annuus]